MSTQAKTKQQVYIQLEKLGFDSSEIEESLNACHSQGLLYNVDWCSYYLAHHLKPSIVHLSHLNETIFAEVKVKCNGFMLNGHASEGHERILERVNKIYNVLFDFLYETQLQLRHKNKTNGTGGSGTGYGGRLSKYIMRCMVFEQVTMDNIDIDAMANAFASILSADCNIFNMDYGRDEFNILLRLLSLHQSQYHMNESFIASLVVDYKQSIVKLPHLQITNDFIHYLHRRCPSVAVAMNAAPPMHRMSHNNMKQQQLSLSSGNTQLSNQYALGPPSMGKTTSVVNEYPNEALMEEDEQEEKEPHEHTANERLINLSECAAVFALDGGDDENSAILSQLFNFYSSQFAHTFIEEGNDYNYIPQEATVELFLSSKLAQHILEIIWNEAKPPAAAGHDHSATIANGLSESQFILAAQLIALAQHNLPYNKHHLLTLLAQSKRIPLPSIYVDASFISYFKCNYHHKTRWRQQQQQNSTKTFNRYSGYSNGGAHAMIKHSKHISAPCGGPGPVSVPVAVASAKPYLSNDASTNTVSTTATTIKSIDINSQTTCTQSISQRPLTQLIPYIPQSHIDNFMVYFNKLDRKKRGYVSGSAIGRFFRKSGLNESILAQVWDLSDIDNDGRLSSCEFCVAMHLINCVRQGAPLPNVLPSSLAPCIDEATPGGGPLAATPTPTAAVPPAPFEAHLNLSNLSKLQISQFIDYRGDDGKYICAQIVDIDEESPSNLLLRSASDMNDTFWCNYHTDMWRIAASKSITQRAVSREEMVSYGVGDRIDINPYHTECHRGWKLGYIIDFAFGQACVSIAKDADNTLYWVHLDNPMEASPPNQHSSSSSTNQHKKKKHTTKNNQSYSKTPKPTSSNHIKNKTKKHHKKKKKHHNNNDNNLKRRASDLTKQETQEIIDCIELARRQSKQKKHAHAHHRHDSSKLKCNQSKFKTKTKTKSLKVKTRTTNYNRHRDRFVSASADVCHKEEDLDYNVFDGYRSPFREFEENPNKKLKLLPQDSNASETAGFVMVNYPTAAAAAAAAAAATAAATQSNDDCDRDQEVNSKHNKYQRPLIQFGSAQTDKEVQYVLKTLNIDHNKRHTLPINAQIGIPTTTTRTEYPSAIINNLAMDRDRDTKRKNSAFTTHHHEPYYNDINRQNGHRYHSHNNNHHNRNNNIINGGTSGTPRHRNHNRHHKRNRSHNPHLDHQQYSNTAPSTPIKLSVKRFKYRSRNRKKSKHHHRDHKTHHKLRGKSGGNGKCGAKSKSKSKSRNKLHQKEKKHRKSSKYTRQKHAQQQHRNLHSYRHTDIV